MNVHVTTCTKSLLDIRIAPLNFGSRQHSQRDYTRHQFIFKAVFPNVAELWILSRPFTIRKPVLQFFYGTQHQSSSITHCHSLVNLSIVYRKCKTSRSIHRPTVQRFSHENNGFKNHDTTAKCGIRLRGLDSSVHTVSGQSYLFFRLWRGLSFEVVMRFFAYSS